MKYSIKIEAPFLVMFFLLLSCHGEDMSSSDDNLNNGIPIVITTSASSILSSSVSVVGEVIDSGAGIISARGVCWSIMQYPVITDSKTIDGSGLGTFVSNITGLTSETSYYARAYATNSEGTAYGNEVVFKTAIAFPTCVYIKAVNVPYVPIVKIGSQCWMQKNLDVSKYRNGDTIPEVTDPTEWANLTTGAWCYYENDTANGPVYGKLYNWYAVNDPRGLAPIDWHIPSDAEWTKLTDFLGGEDIAGVKMKVMTGWSTNIDATNSSGFTGIPGGNREYTGPFENVGYNGGWWSATEYNDKNAYYRGLYHNGGTLHQNIPNKIYGYSVRCLLD
jgi:uncharacterized protein (TIGR02145 family)